jgi:hypothetical protein
VYEAIREIVQRISLILHLIMLVPVLTKWKMSEGDKESLAAVQGLNFRNTVLHRMEGQRERRGNLNLCVTRPFSLVTKQEKDSRLENERSR